MNNPKLTNGMTRRQYGAYKTLKEFGPAVLEQGRYLCVENTKAIITTGMVRILVNIGVAECYGEGQELKVKLI